nr:DUF501 domain-containing protein [Mobiluncus mulieris]
MEIIAAQLGRVPRGVLGIAAYCNLTTPPNAAHAAPHPAVIATTPRLPNGEPFPTFYYLTCPAAVAACSQLEAAGVMREAEALLDDPQHPEFRLAYHRAHRAYLAARRVASPAPVPEIANFSAGGMPNRVKCFHALLGHALAAGLGVNPVGDWVLARLRAENLWSPETCDWHPEP